MTNVPLNTCLYRVLGIDSGAKRCGLAVLCDTDKGLSLQYADYVEQGALAGEKYGDHRRRLVAEWTVSLEAAICGFQPDLVVCETVPITGAANASGQRLKALMVVVVAQSICVRFGIPFKEVGANTVKKRLTGNGDATKPKVREAVISVFPELAARRKEMVAVPDISDAVAVALTGLGYDHAD